VDACTDAYEDPKPDWRPRKQAYIEHMRTAPPPVLLVSCADKLHNARCTLQDLCTDGPSVWERFTGRREGTLWYYRSLREIFDARLAAPVTRLFSEVVHDLEHFGEDAERHGFGR
jgi:(p)ppGpp synthase/HD superfamily hydrolase